MFTDPRPRIHKQKYAHIGTRNQGQGIELGHEEAVQGTLGDEEGSKHVIAGMNFVQIKKQVPHKAPNPCQIEALLQLRLNHYKSQASSCVAVPKCVYEAC